MNKETLSRRVFPALTLIGASGVLLAALDRPSTGIDLGAAPPIGTDASVSAAATTTTSAAKSALCRCLERVGQRGKTFRGTR